MDENFAWSPSVSGSRELLWSKKLKELSDEGHTWHANFTTYVMSIIDGQILTQLAEKYMITSTIVMRIDTSEDCVTLLRK